MIQVGDRFESPDTANVLRVVSVSDRKIGVIREVDADHWDYGHVYHWVPETFSFLVPIR